MGATLDKIFMVCAAAGGTVFVLRMIMMVIGFAGSDTDAEIDTGGDVDVDLDGGDMDHIDSGDLAEASATFQLISVQGVTAFFMIFGLVGLGCLRTGIAHPLSVGAAFAAGFVMMVLVAKIFQLFKGLQSSGTMNLDNAIGQEGSVYLTIPADGRGKVQVPVQGRLKIFEAEAEEDVELPSGTRIKVVKVVSGNIFIVRKV